VDGYELTFAANHLGHFLLVHLLLEQAQPPARIIFVSSGAHDGSRANGPMQPPRYVGAEWLAYPQSDPGAQANDDIAGGQAYANSKLCNVLCAHELSRRLQAGGLSTPELPITSNAFDPGLMAGTGLGRYGKGLMRLAWNVVLPLASRLFKFGRTTAQSGADLAYLASASHLSGVK
jgi:NAD(P)-dependent dehydrogenase (short-subunit alcohol dehydrogenase family)